MFQSRSPRRMDRLPQTQFQDLCSTRAVLVPGTESSHSVPGTESLALRILTAVVKTWHEALWWREGEYLALLAMAEGEYLALRALVEGG